MPLCGVGEEEAGKKRLQPPPPFVGMLSFTIYGGGLASNARAAPGLPLLTNIKCLLNEHTPQFRFSISLDSSLCSHQRWENGGRRNPKRRSRTEENSKGKGKNIRTLFLTALSGLDFPFTAISKVCSIADPFSFYWYLVHCVAAATVVCSALNMILCQMART